MASAGGGVHELKVGEQRLLSRDDMWGEAAEVWQSLDAGVVVWLSGDLGAGKTTFVQAMAAAAGAERPRSPTFALVHEYPSPQGLLIHVDCYRLRTPEEAIDLDFPDLCSRARALLIEWPDRAGSHAPPPNVHFAFYHCDDASMRLVRREA